MNNRQIVRSFDLFDTLVARRCVSPQAIFDIVEARTRIKGFARARIAAESLVCSDRYTMEDIYRALSELLGLNSESIDSLRRCELAAEWDNLIPVAENCAMVRAGDLIISDMYLPMKFVVNIVSEVCGLRFNPVFLSPSGKRDGTVWPRLAGHFSITQHLGDNTLSDYASPQRHAVIGRLTSVAQRTAREDFLAKSGFSPLADLIREVRLITWDVDQGRRQAQLAQIEGNFPLLFLASLHLARLAERNAWEVILFSSRDCYLWSRLYTALSEVLRLNAKIEYFYTSRVAKVNPSSDYRRYFESIRSGRVSVVVDICGTGWSSQQLIERAPGPPTSQFLIHHIRNSYRFQQFASIPNPAPLHAMTLDGDNETWELLNRADHPMVLDVAALAGQFLPIFSTTRYDDQRAKLIELQNAAFLKATALVRTLSRDQIERMTQRLTHQVLAELYRNIPSNPTLVELLEHHRVEEREVDYFLTRRKQAGESPQS